MKFIHKIFYIFISLFFLCLLYNFILNKDLFFNSIQSTIILWFYKILPSISISYILAMFLYNYPLISYILFPILKPIYNFQNRKSCSLFLISIIVGVPTSINLINSALKNNEITSLEANRLMCFSSFISSIFLFTIFNFNIFIIILIIELIISVIISNVMKQENTNIHFKTNAYSFLDIYFNIISTIPTLLLNILISMIFCNILSLSINNNYIKSLLELTNGIIILQNLTNSPLNFSILLILLITHGSAIILQIYWIIKNSSLSFLTFLKYRIFSVFIGLISLMLIYLFVFFL